VDVGAGIDGRVSRLLARVVEVSEEVASLAFDGLADAELEHLLDGLRVPLARLEAARARGLADLERRAARRAPSGGATAAELEQRRRNAARQRLAPSVAKRAAEAGRAAADHAATGAAFRSGELDADHVRVIGGLLRRVPLGERDRLEDELVALARQLDPVAFGRRARELVARRAPAAAARVEQLAENQRSVRAADTAEGGFAFSGVLHGTAAETARVAFAAFRRPDTPDEHRRPEQGMADAFEQLCAAALRAGDAPTVHGVRPQVVVVVDEADLSCRDGVARMAHSGQTLSSGAVGHLLSDATVSRLVRDAAGAPLEASVGVRTVPAGLWKALLARDGGCTWSGCDAPAAWCDVAHGEEPYRRHGQLAPDNAALLCRRHHRRFDTGPFRMVVRGAEVLYERRTAAAAEGPGSSMEHGPGSMIRRRDPGLRSTPSSSDGPVGERSTRPADGPRGVRGARSGRSDPRPATLFDLVPTHPGPSGPSADRRAPP